VLDLAIIQHSSFVELYAPAMDLSGKGDLVRVEVLPARLASDFVGQIAQDVFDRTGNISDAGIKRQIYILVVSNRQYQ
jgi:hypothetical protein